jgi:guanyl-specific ribonuclease Sa
MNLRNNMTACVFVASLGLIACSPTPATNSNQRSFNSNAAQSNASPASSSQNRPVQQSATTGSIEVNSVPPGARVLLVSTDEGGAGEPQQKGLTPVTIPGLSPGKYTVDLERPGYKFFQKEVTVKAGGTAKVSANLKKQ